MASLDDFFAKKDKKKGKGKAVLSAGALVKELEEGSKKAEYPVRKETKTSTAIELLGLDADDADWRDFEDVEKRDYSGLKVKEMSLQDQTEDEQRRLVAEHTEPVSDATAWKIKDDSAPTTEESAAVSATEAPQPKAPTTSNPDCSNSKTDKPGSTEVPATIANPESKTSQTSLENPEKQGDKPSAKKVYVPPHERGGGEVKLLEPVRLSKTKTASTRHEKMPDLQDKTLFPSLG